MLARLWVELEVVAGAGGGEGSSTASTCRMTYSCRPMGLGLLLCVAGIIISCSPALASFQFNSQGIADLF